MKKVISSIMITIMILLSFHGCAFATAQLEATIEITPSTTEVVPGDKVIFTFVTKNIANSEFGKIYAIEGVIQYDKNFFQLEAGGMEVGETGEFVSMTPVGEGGTNGTITLKVVDNPTGSGVVKFTELAAGDGRLEDSETLGIAKTADKEFTITIKNEGGNNDDGGNETPCEHTYGNYVDNGDGTHSAECTKCGEKHTANHSYENGACTVCGAKEQVKDCEHKYGEYVDNNDGTHSAECTECGEKHTENHTYENDTCTKCKAVQTPQKEEEDKAEDKKDETTADKEIPKAGLSTLLVSGMAIITFAAIIMYRKTKKYQDIK